MKNLTKIISYSDLGNVTFVQSRNSTRIRISIRPFKGIRVAYPFGITSDSAEVFLLSKKEWVQKQLAKIAIYEEEILSLQQNREQIDVKAACEHLYQRLIFWAEKYNFQFNRITFRRQKTRWGSCSAKNNLNLNINLYRLPEELQDYVILHELVHTRIKNHSPIFWQELEKVLPGAKLLNKELRKYRILTV